MPLETQQEDLHGGASKGQGVSDESSGHRKRTRDGEEHPEVSLSTSNPDINAKKPRAGTREENQSEGSSDAKRSEGPKSALKNSVPTAMPTAMPTTCCAESTTSVPVVMPTPALANMQQPAMPFVLTEDDHPKTSGLAEKQKDSSPLPASLVTPGAVTSITSDNATASRDQPRPPTVLSVSPAPDSTGKGEKQQEESTEAPASQAEQSKDTKPSPGLGQSTEAEQSKDAEQSASTPIDKPPLAATNDLHGKQDAKREQSTSAPNLTSIAQDAGSAKSTQNKSGPSLGFGAFAARSTPFQTASANAKETSPQTPSGSTSWAQTEGEPASTDADDIVVRKKSVRKPDTDLPTGEEEEQTMASIRAKLFAMSSDHSWKERGTGLLKINTRSSRETTRPTARLVMRSDAVFKVILNVQIFAGMQCHIEQERFLRFVALEEEGLVHFAVKFANANDAHTFMEQLQDHIPASSSRDSA